MYGHTRAHKHVFVALLYLKCASRECIQGCFYHASARVPSGNMALGEFMQGQQTVAELFLIKLSRNTACSHKPYLQRVNMIRNSYS